MQYYLQDRQWEKAFDTALKLDSINQKSGPADRTPLLYFIYFQAPVEYIKKLLENGADVDAVDKDNWNAIFYCLLVDNIDYIEILAKYGINMEHRKLLGKAFFEFNKKEKAHWTLMYGDTKNIEDEIRKALGHTALCYELEKKCRFDYIEALLKNGANVNNKLIDKWIDNFKNKTSRFRPIMSILLHNEQLHKSMYLPISELLIKFGAQINEMDVGIKEKGFRTLIAIEKPIERASEIGLHDVVKLLLDKHIEYQIFMKEENYIYGSAYIAKTNGHHAIYQLTENIMKTYKKENNLFPYNLSNFAKKIFGKGNSETSIEITQECNFNKIDEFSLFIKTSLEVSKYQIVIDMLENIDIEIDRIISCTDVNPETLKKLSNLLYVLEQKCYRETLWAEASFFYQQPFDYREFKESVYCSCPINVTEEIAMHHVGFVNPREQSFTRNIFTINQIYFLFANFIYQPSESKLENIIATIDAVINLLTERLLVLFKQANEQRKEKKAANEEQLQSEVDVMSSKKTKEGLENLLELCKFIKKSKCYERTCIDNLFLKNDEIFQCDIVVEIYYKYPQLILDILDFIGQYQFVLNEINKQKRVEEIFEKLLQYTMKVTMSTKQEKLYCVDFIMENTIKDDFLYFFRREDIGKMKMKDLTSLTKEEFNGYK